MMLRYYVFTLFPYTTLFRSVDAVDGDGDRAGGGVGVRGDRHRLTRHRGIRGAAETERGDERPDHLLRRGRGVRVILRVAARSEEHTSELQSQSNLVCRLLLE